MSFSNKESRRRFNGKYGPTFGGFTALALLAIFFYHQKQLDAENSTIEFLQYMPICSAIETDEMQVKEVVHWAQFSQDAVNDRMHRRLENEFFIPKSRECRAVALEEGHDTLGRMQTEVNGPQDPKKQAEAKKQAEYITGARALVERALQDREIHPVNVPAFEEIPSKEI